MHQDIIAILNDSVFMSLPFFPYTQYVLTLILVMIGNLFWYIFVFALIKVLAYFIWENTNLSDDEVSTREWIMFLVIVLLMHSMDVVTAVGGALYV